MASFSGSHRSQMQSTSRSLQTFYEAAGNMRSSAQAMRAAKAAEFNKALQLGHANAMVDSAARQGAFGIPGRAPRIPLKEGLKLAGGSLEGPLFMASAVLASMNALQGQIIIQQQQQNWSYDFAGWTTLCSTDPNNFPGEPYFAVGYSPGSPAINATVCTVSTINTINALYGATIPGSATYVQLLQRNSPYVIGGNRSGRVWKRATRGAAGAPMLGKRWGIINTQDPMAKPLSGPPATTAVPFPKGDPQSGPDPLKGVITGLQTAPNPVKPPPGGQGTSGGAGASGSWGPKPDPQGNKENTSYKLPAWEIIWRNDHPETNMQGPPPRPPEGTWHYLRPDGSKKIKMDSKLWKLIRLYHGATEVKDFFESLAGAIPGGECSTQPGFAMAMCVMQNWHKIDWAQAVKNLIANEIEDQVVGRLIGQLGQNFQAVGGPNTTQLTGYLRPAMQAQRQALRRMR